MIQKIFLAFSFQDTRWVAGQQKGEKKFSFFNEILSCTPRKFFSVMKFSPTHFFGKIFVLFRSLLRLILYTPRRHKKLFQKTFFCRRRHGDRSYTPFFCRRRQKSFSKTKKTKNEIVKIQKSTISFFRKKLFQKTFLCRRRHKNGV